MPLANLRNIRAESTTIIAQPRGRPSEVAQENLRNHRGALDLSMSPMMIEPLDQLGGRKYQGIILVGPQRSSKTFGLVLGGLTYIAMADPGDTLVTTITQEKAREFSNSELGNALRYSPNLLEKLSPRASDDNTYDKWFRSGMTVKLGWPAISQLSSSTYRYVFLTDYDRPTNRDNVDGEGPLWDAAFRRVLTYMTRGKCLAESSPGEDWADVAWKPNPQFPHEAPPALGILSLYNNGTRARWMWPCKHCNEYFQAKPGWDAFAMPPTEELRDILLKKDDIESLVLDYARVPCPNCGGLHEQTDKMAMTLSGMWMHEGQTIVGGELHGEPRATNIWSGWLGGCAASYQRWDGMIRNYLQAVKSYARTGDESSMRMASTSDAAAPYMPMGVRNKQGKEMLLERVEAYDKGTVPPEVRFLTAAVDVHARRFVVQVHGWGVELQQWLIDRYEITGSRRSEGDHQAGIDPTAFVEDWESLLPIIAKKYPVIGQDRFMNVKLAFVDSGGAEGVTENAYKFWRSLARRGLGRRIQLVKGDGRLGSPRVVRTWPDTSNRSDRAGHSRGDVPVWFLNTNLLKDGIAADLSRDLVGPGYFHLPHWLNDEDRDIFDELIAEIRTAKGWANPSNRRNEALDLAVYNRGALIALKGESIDWEHPPEWAEPWDPTKAPKPSATTVASGGDGDAQEQARKVEAARRAQQRQQMPTTGRGWVKNWRQ